ncbi:solute carrier family 22 member 13-like [Vanessa tameamea]|uniref:Solute carrier family 22 member 13-like n=1 Tax=Vanessa tameamea TaxID=334116 RepID=A0ABM4AM68_VANTA
MEGAGTEEHPPRVQYFLCFNDKKKRFINNTFHLYLHKNYLLLYFRIGTIHEDVTTDVLGLIGRWQWLVTFASATLMVPSMLNEYEDMLLLEPSEDIYCDLSDTISITNSSLCTFTVLNGTKEIKCNIWHIKFMWIIWIKKTWLVFCDQRTKVLSTTIICRLGLLFGCIIFGLVSDNFGRKRAITIDVLADLGFRLILIFCDTESWFNLLIFLRSIFASANIYTGLVLISEVASSTWRTSLSAIVSTPRLLASVCLVPLAKAAPNLETFNFMACLFDVFLLFLLRWTPESPQWLLFNRKITQAEKILQKAARINRINVCSNFKIRPVNHRAYDCLDENQTCLGIITKYNIRVLSISMLVFWSFYYFLWSSLYIGIYSKHNQYTLLKLLTIIALLSVFNTFLYKKVTLKFLLVINIGLLGACNISRIFMEWFKVNHSAFEIVTSISLGTGVIIHGLILNITPRLFAINIRCTSLGCCHSSGQLGSIICYLIVSFHAFEDVVLIVIETGLAIGLLLLCYVIPDVDRRELPDIMEDMDYFSELSKPLRWATQKTNSPSNEELEIRAYSFGSTGQNYSANNHHNERLPAQRIGFRRFLPLFQGFTKKTRRIFHI